MIYFDTVIRNQLARGDITYLVMYTEVNLFCIILLLQVIRRSHDSIRLKNQEDFNRAILSACAVFASDTLIVLMDYAAIPMIRWVYLLIKDAYFFSVGVMSFAWFIHAQNLVNNKFVNHRKDIWKWSGMLIAAVILLLINWKIPFLFGVSDHTYIRGPLFLLNYVFGYSYIVMAVFVALRASFQKEHFADKDTLRSFICLPFPPALAGISQYYYPEIPVLCCAVTAIIEYMSMKAASTLISLDPLTQLNNRRRFVVKLQSAIDELKPEENLYVMIMDIDYFKTINDTYGHPEGDEALLIASRSIAKAVGRIDHSSVVARYGGDEFIVFSRTEGDDCCEKIQKAIEEELKKEKEVKQKPYDITMSYGFVRYEPNMSIADVVAAADQKLYQIKQEHHKQRI